MPIPDRLEGPFPSRQVPVPSAAASSEYEDEFCADAPPPKTFSIRLAWRAVRRNWWQALLLWAAATAAVMALAYYGIKPTYEAVAQFRIEPGEQALFTKNVGLADFAQYRESQLTLVTSPVVLGSALAKHPELMRYPRLATALNAEDEIRQIVRPQIIRNTNQIQVAMTAQSAQEASDIVNAVVEAYLDFARDVNDKETKRRIDKLKEVEEQSQNEVTLKRHKLEKLRDDMGDKAVSHAKEARVSISHYEELNRQLLATEIDKQSAQARLDKLRGVRDEFTRTQDPGQLRQAAYDLFYADPRVNAVQERLGRAQLALEDAQRRAKDALDPARRRHQRAVDAEQAKLSQLSQQIWPSILQKVNSGLGGDEVNHDLAEAESRLQELSAREQTLKEKLHEVNLKNETAGGDALKVEFARSDLSNAEAVLQQVQASLKQQEFEAKGSIARAHLDYRARPSFRPFSNHRTKVMALAPIGVWLGVMGFLVLLEFHSGRVADPEELSSRAHLQILGVVPPLPPVRPAHGLGLLPGRGEDRAQRQLAEFVQSLDHLRVALCAKPDPWGRDRHCVLITSACGSEGKTTLAAQLAERCVNAGLMTLLIDADLRNPTLSRMLDATTLSGLVNVLRGEVAPEAAMTVVADAGGFHFLPAGTPRVDPSRLLQGDRLGNLLARARESFDMIIVDAPPVLPVPDALTIGRWTDGAILAVRYDSSRFPLVDRANRRLAHVGVPVLGAVVSGVRSAAGSYGDYYAYGGSSTVEAS